jgi:hypothetical protein
MSTPAITGPVPPYSNVNIAPQNFQPSQFFISAIGLGSTTTVTTTVNNNYVIGQEVRLLIPPSFGCRQLDGQTGFVLSLPAQNQVQININSSVNVDPFIASSATTQPQIVAIGNINTGNNDLVSSVTIPGAFINIS